MVPGSAVEIASGLHELNYSCAVEGRTLFFHELQLERGSPLQMRALRNPTARSIALCPGGQFGGADLTTFLHAIQGFQVFGAANGNMFANRGGSNLDPWARRLNHFFSIGFLWTRPVGFRQDLAERFAQSSVMAPLSTQHGEAIFIADLNGGHVLGIRPHSCPGNENEPCVSLTGSRATIPASARSAFREHMTQEAFIQALEQAFPTMTLVTQLSQTLGTANISCEGHSANHWLCLRDPRTVLCSRNDGSISVFNTAGQPSEVREALRVGGTCGAGCDHLFNLDGGGSTQMAVRVPAANGQNSGSSLLRGPSARHRRGIYNASVQNGFEYSANRTTSGPNVDRCGVYRPVDHYFIFGRE